MNRISGALRFGWKLEQAQQLSRLAQLCIFIFQDTHYSELKFNLIHDHRIAAQTTALLYPLPLDYIMESRVVEKYRKSKPET
jgi:hypothetical protein